jgi:aryl-alcohol dehydrogenase-like predicted oxidoreductase
MVHQITLPHSDLTVSSLCFGANVFGWSIHDQSEANRLLGELFARGVNFFDTADMYVQWVAGNSGGESERAVGDWLRTSRVNRDDVVIATKVGKMTTRPGLSPHNILAAADESLSRLGIDTIDLYYAHRDDDSVPMEDTLGAFQHLIDAGKVRDIGASNFSASRLSQALTLAETHDLPRYVAVQNHYNLVAREPYESDMAPLVEREGLWGLPYFSLASGFLTGKYRRGEAYSSVRQDRVENDYVSEENFATLDRLLSVATRLGVAPATVALEWLRQQPGVTVPIASASRIDQLDDLLAEVTLPEDQIAFLSGG